MALRVLLSAYACRPGFGSEPGCGWNWALELAKAGASVWVLTRQDNKADIENALRDLRHLDLHFVYIDHGKLGRVLQRLPLGEYWKHIQWQERAYKVAKQLQQRAGTFDIAHHVSYGSLHIGSRLWRLGCPFIFGPVGGGQTAPPGFRRHFRGGWITECIRTITARHLFAHVLNARSTARGAALVLAANRDTEAATRLLGATRVSRMTDVGLPAAQIRKHPRIARSREEPLRVLWVAGLRPRKGLLLALEAASLIEMTRAWDLTVIGNGPQGVFLPRWVRALALQGKVVWRGAIPWEDVLQSYDNADLFLFTSLRDTTGGQLLEAMARGLPIVALNHHGAATLVPDSAGIKVAVSTARETAADLARAIERLAADPDLLQRMGKAAIEAAQNHTWDRKALDALSVYREVLTRRGGPDRVHAGSSKPTVVGSPEPASESLTQ